MSILTLAYVVITGIYACIASRTLKAIQDQGTQAKEEAISRDKQFAEQLRVSKDAAEAALLNARAIINSERPWIVVTDVSTNSQVACDFEASNYGRTPAEIVSQHTAYKIVDNQNDVPIISPENPTGTSVNRRLLVPAHQVSEARKNDRLIRSG